MYSSESGEAIQKCYYLVYNIIITYSLYSYNRKYAIDAIAILLIYYLTSSNIAAPEVVTPKVSAQEVVISKVVISNPRSKSEFEFEITKEM